MKKIILILTIFVAGCAGFVSAQEKDQNQARGGALPPGETTAFKKIIIEESNRPSAKSPYEGSSGTLPSEEQQKFIKYYDKQGGGSN